MYEQVKTDKTAVYEHGVEFRPVATLASPSGGRCQISVDDHCYIVSLLTADGRYRATTHIFPEAHKVLATLPLLKQG